MNTTSLTAKREHLAILLEVVQRCTHFMHASGSKVFWPLHGVPLRQRCKEVDLFDSLAASRLRSSEVQENLGMTTRSIANVEEQDVDLFGAVIVSMERLKIIDSADHWKLISEPCNAVNHEYEDDGARLAEFFELMVGDTPKLVGCFTRLQAHCDSTYSLFQ